MINALNLFFPDRAAPSGSAVCVYDLNAIEASFKGPIANGRGFEGGKNSFPDIVSYGTPYCKQIIKCYPCVHDSVEYARRSSPCRWCQVCDALRPGIDVQANYQTNGKS